MIRTLKTLTVFFFISHVRKSVLTNHSARFLNSFRILKDVLGIRNFTNQGPVARSLVSANRWLRGIKMYRFPWYLTLVSTNHASSNPGQIVWHCSNEQSALRPKSGRSSTGVRNFVSGPILARPRKRERVEAAKIGPGLRLKQFSSQCFFLVICGCSKLDVSKRLSRGNKISLYFSVRVFTQRD